MLGHGSWLTWLRSKNTMSLPSTEPKAPPGTPVQSSVPPSAMPPRPAAVSAQPAAPAPTVPGQPAAAPAGTSYRSRLRSALIPLLILLLAAGLLMIITSQWNAWTGERSRQVTDDAYVRADITPLSTKISGIVALVAVGDYQRVKAGDLLVQINDDDFQAQIEQAEAAVLAAQAALERLHKQQELQASKIAQAEAQINATKADVERTQLERHRQEALEKVAAGTHQALEQAMADERRFRATLASRQAELEAQSKEIAVLDAQKKQLEADVNAKKAALKLARINLGYTQIVAPTDGVVGERKVRAGQLVSPGTQVISLVSLPNVWVVANYKETQLAHVRIGDKAEVTVDGVPGVVFTGHVDTISPASGSQFSLLPPDNATGNFTKVIQRISVKIVLDPHRDLIDHLRPGMSVIATIRTDQARDNDRLGEP
jgi:membrane fusion protein (multidrug efflux system)